MEKIFFYTDNIDCLGGAEKVILNLSEEFSNDYEIFIISNKRSYENECTLDKKFNLIDLNLNFKNIFLRKIEIIIKLNKLLKNQKGFILGVGAWNAIGLTFVINKKLIKIASEHLAYSKIPRRTRILRRIFYRYLNGIIILSNFDLEKFKKLNKNICIIPNYINNNLNLEKSNLKNKKIVAIGRLEYQKGFDKLLNIWSEIEKRNKEWILEIYGEGTQKEELLRLKKELKLQRVLFCGQTREPQRKILESSIYVMTSRYEGFGLVLLEAFSVGVPCISFDCETGPREIIENNINGFLIKDNDLKDFEKKLLYLMENYDERKKMSLSMEKILEKYSKEKIIKLWYDFFENKGKKWK